MIIISQSPALFHIYGPLFINVYGFCIAIALIISLYAIVQNKRYKDLNLEDSFSSIILVATGGAVVGARLLIVLSEPFLYTRWFDWFALYNGGFSCLGAIVGATVASFFYIKSIPLSVLAVFDLMAIYAPLFQSIARLGCLCAGCCYGCASSHWFSVMYLHPCAMAPLGIALHPTQMYSSVLLFLIFLYFYVRAQHAIKTPGILFGQYLALISVERFVTDFWRNDRLMFCVSFLSFHQLVSIFIFLAAMIMIGYRILYVHIKM